MSGSESGWIVFVWGDGFPIELKPGINVVQEEVEIFLECFV